jgi:hypothetical protein
MPSGPAASVFRTGGKEAIMEESKKAHNVDYGCKSRFMEEFVECTETEDRASICKIRERKCLCECEL